MKITRNIESIYAVVSSVPKGRVATYGQIAEVAGLPGRARLVGRALRELPDDTAVPWHRVVGAGGRISARGDGEGEREQRLLLADEGVVVEAGGRVRLERFGWQR